MTTAIVRLLCAIVVSPIVPGVAIWILNTATGGSSSDYAWIWLSAVIGYPILILLGLPLFYVCLKRNWLTLWHFLAFGGALGCLGFLTPVIVGVVVALLENVPVGVVVADSVESFGISKFIVYLPVCAASGMVAAVCFWVIARPSFATWRKFVNRKGAL